MNTQVPDDEGIVVFLLREYVIPFLVFGYMITWLVRNVAVPLYSEGFFLTRRPIHDGSSTQEGSDDDSKHKQH